MRLPFSSWLSVALLSCSLAVPALRADSSPADDLRPLAPVSRTLFAGNPQFQMRFNGSTQAFSADGKTLYMNSHMGLTFWDLTNPKANRPRTVNERGLFFHNAAVALSPDGKTAAVMAALGGNQDMPIRFFDTVSGKEVRQIENDQQIHSLSYSPDGRLLAVGSYQTLELWDAVSGDEVRRFVVEPNTNYQLLTFSPDGKMLAAVNNLNRWPPPDDSAVVIELWETASGKSRGRIRLTPPLPASQEPRQYYPNRGINGLAFSVDGRFLAISGNDSAIHLWDLRRGEEGMPLTGFEGNAGALLFTPDGRELLAMGQQGSLFSWSTKDIRQRNAQRLPSLDDAAFAALWEELSSSDVFRAHCAARHLKADPERAVALLGKRLKPVPPGDSARIRKLVADLASADAGVRRKAMMELRHKHGEAVVGALRENPNRARNGYGMTFEQKLIQLYNTPERARDLRALPILEEIATPAARQVLEKLSNGAAGVGLTTEAKAALDRLRARREQPRERNEEQLWADLASDDAGRAFRAMCGLSAKPELAVALLGKRLKPVPVFEEKEIAALLADLDADDFKRREEATKELEKIGEQALPVLKKTLDANPSLEARKRMERLLERAAAQTSAPLLRGLRAVEVLEHSGTAESKHVLVALAGGAPNARLTREAKASLQRLLR